MINLPAFMQVYASGATSSAEVLSTSAVDVIMYSLIGVFIVIIAFVSYTHQKTSRRLEELSEEMIIVERTKSEHRIAERTRALVQSEEKRLIELDRTAKFGKLSQGLFHDLMNPLAAFTSYAESMSDRSSVDRDIIDAMVSVTRRLGSYMDSVKRCLETDRAQPVQSSDIAHEAAIVKDVLAYKARMAAVDIKIEKMDAMSLSIHPVRLHQLLLNLVMNAIDACVEQSARSAEPVPMNVVISARKSGDTTIISVKDNGIGMSPSTQDKLFKETFTTKEKGTGIGLMTVKNIVENDLRGTITIKSEENKGAEFTIEIPKK